MISTVNLASSVPNWENFPLTQPPKLQQLYQMQTHLDAVKLALDALITLDQEMMQQATLALEINDDLINEIGTLSNPTEDNDFEPLPIEQMRSLILIICYLARQHQDLIRRAVTLLEQMIAQGTDPTQTTLLGNYFQKFNKFYQSETAEAQPPSMAHPTQLASKLLIDLFFYSTDHGHHRLWLTLLDYTR